MRWANRSASPDPNLVDDLVVHPTGEDVLGPRSGNSWNAFELGATLRLPYWNTTALRERGLRLRQQSPVLPDELRYAVHTGRKGDLVGPTPCVHRHDSLRRIHEHVDNLKKTWNRVVEVAIAPAARLTEWGRLVTVRRSTLQILAAS